MKEPPVIQGDGVSSKPRRWWLYLLIALLVVLYLFVLMRFFRHMTAPPIRPVASLPVVTNTPVLIPPRAPAPVVLEAPQVKVIEAERSPADFFGKWTGKWDQIWEIRLTISPGPEGGKLSALYEWVEHLGDPHSQMKLQAELAGDVLNIGNMIDLTLSTTDTNRAVAVGKFRIKRTARMVRN